MKSSRQVCFALFGSLLVAAGLPSCVVVDPGYVAVSTGYTSHSGNRGYGRSHYYSQPTYCAPVTSCDYVAPSCGYVAPSCGYRSYRSYSRHNHCDY